MSAPVQRAVPIAWVHTMHMEGGQSRAKATLSDKNPFGRPGVDYSESFVVKSVPTYAAPAQPAAPADLPGAALWMTSESSYRLKQGGSCKGAVPVHGKPSSTAKIPLFTEDQMRAALAQPVAQDKLDALAKALTVFVDALDGKRAANNSGEPGFEFNDAIWANLEPARAAILAAKGGAA